MRTLLRSVGTAAGLDRIGFASVAPFEDVEADIRRRKDEGLSNRLAFTYADPKGATDLRRHFPWAESLVVAARSYKPSAQTGHRGGRVAAAARWPGYAPLRDGLAAIQKVLVDQGHQAEVLCDDNRLVDRAAAVRAGIGWWGKNTMVLAPGLGPWFLLGSVVTSLRIHPDRPMERGCGSCSACLPACPTGALVAPGILDARLCLAAWAQTGGVVPLELRVPMGQRLYGCDDCLDACPPGRPLHALGENEGLKFDLRWVLWASDWTLLEHFGHWFLPDRDPRIIRRNALIAAGNSGEREMTSVVGPYASHPDWLLRTHALWALGRLGGAEAKLLLAQRAQAETDPRVLQEFGRVPIGK